MTTPHRISTALVVLILLISSVMISPASGQSIDEARQAFEAGDYEAAAAAYEAVLEADAGNRAARLGLANSQLWLGDYRGAEKTIGTLIENPSDTEAAWIMAQSLFYQAEDLRLNSEIPSNLAIRSRFNDAERFSTVVLEAEPGRNDVQVFRGNTRFWLEDLEGAEKDYRAVLVREPENASLHYTLGDLLARYLGKHAEAVAPLERALELQPDFPEAYQSLGLAYLGTGDDARAVDAFVEALKRRPNDSAVFSTLWERYGKPQQFEEGLAVYDKILEKAPENYIGRWHRAFIYEQQSRFDEALAECRAVLEVREDWNDVRAFMAKIFLKQDRPEDAIEAWTKVLEADPENSDAYEGLLGLARSRGESNDYEASLEVFDTLIKFFPENPTLRADRALTLYNMNRTEDAIRAYEDAIRADPLDSQILNDLGLVYQGQKDYAKATKAFLDAIELDNNIDAQENFAVLLFKLNETIQASNRFEKVLFIDPSRERSLKYYLECRRVLDLELLMSRREEGK